MARKKRKKRVRAQKRRVSARPKKRVRRKRRRVVKSRRKRGRHKRRRLMPALDRRKKYKRKHRYKSRRPALSPEQIQRNLNRQANERRAYANFDKARSAIAERMGVSPGHADAHYRALIEVDGMKPEDAWEATYGYQP